MTWPLTLFSSKVDELKRILSFGCALCVRVDCPVQAAQYKAAAYCNGNITKLFPPTVPVECCACDNDELCVTLLGYEVLLFQSVNFQSIVR